MRYFAEFLRKIGILTVVVEDVTAVNVDLISNDKMAISYIEPGTDKEQSKEFTLPCECDPIPLEQLPSFKESARNVFTLRRRISQSKTFSSTSAALLLRWDDEGKWHKKDLESLGNFSLRCKKCKTQILPAGGIPIRLSSLPSENWYELMDYWHCHKPDIPTNGTMYQVSRNSLRPVKGEILVGGSYFLISTETADSIPLEIDSSKDTILCKSCMTTKLGTMTSDGLFKIFKWSLLLDLGHKTEQFDPADDILISLLDLAKNKSERYAILKQNGTEPTLVMLFATGNPVTLTDGSLLPNAIKLLYTQDKELVSSTRAKHSPEELIPLREPYEDFMRKLTTTNKLLPNEIAHFGPWNVSYLQLS